ncbi:trypsin inhibitor BvTI [Beta vulgaris subsp. vulgaris]|uniref:trypsin inhibitor BvTI n=1 Tax=Beta vulgaris subsp. vulgaris TaxID=3555 RepID=UPI0020374392|nr:trypsin inhibitor BvTI [Beta vulgaris subsp. vulgaris]
MASIFLKSTITLLLIFSALSVATAFVLDTDGEPLFNQVNNSRYYILPQTIGIGGGLTRTTKNPELPCPYYITRDNDETSSGMPLYISSPLRILFIPLSSPVHISFEEMTTICIQESMGWRVISDDSTGRLYVSTGAGRGPGRFTIEQAESESSNNVYKIRYIGALDSEAGAGDLGFFKEDGLLGITDDIPLTVVFKKAFDVPEETTTSM